MKFQLVIIFCVYILLLANPYAAVEESQMSNMQPQSSTEVVPIEHLGFVQAFLKTLSVIFVSEIGDKTFFIAAIMAMKHPRAMVFLGAMSALAFMTVISVLGGWALSLIPKKYTYYGSVILFLLFGIKMIYDGMRMSPNEGQEEYEEVQAELRKKEEECVTDSKVGLESIKIQKSTIMDTLKLYYRTLFEKETLAKDVEAGRVDKNSKMTILKVLSHIVVQAFTLTFVAEWGDRSQLATFLLAAKDNKFGITLGGIAGHSICTGIAVTGGRFVAQKISVKTVTILGGVVFIACALITLVLENEHFSQ